MHPDGANSQKSPPSNHSYASLLPVLLKSLLTGILISLLLLLLMVVAWYFTPLPERYGPVMVFVISAAGIITGSYQAGKNLGYQGWLNGGLVGVGYVLVVIVLGLILGQGFSAGITIISKLFLGFVLGLVGGVWGVNS